MLVKDFVRDGRWHWEKFQHIISMDSCPAIAALPPPIEEFGNDIVVWSLAKDGCLSAKSVYEFLCANNLNKADNIWETI